MTLEDIINRIVVVEGGYSNNPNDSGGETIWGVTVAVARLYGFKGNMKDMTREQAKDIYMERYVKAPQFDLVYAKSPRIAEELIDTGINMGIGIASTFLQRALNVFNKGATIYPDLKLDGSLGPKSLQFLQVFLNIRGVTGELVMLRALNALQGARYLNITEQNPKNEDFVFGWFLNRVVI